MFPTYAVTAKLVAQVEREREKTRKGQEGDSGSSSKKRTLEDPIPKKGKPGKKPNPNKRPKKMCQLCAKWSPAIMHTHNTDQCKKWESDGTPKKKVRQPEQQNNANAMAATFKECFAQMQKDLKRDLKRSSSRKKKKSKKRYDLSSDSESSEDEE